MTFLRTARGGASDRPPGPRGGPLRRPAPGQRPAPGGGPALGRRPRRVLAGAVIVLLAGAITAWLAWPSAPGIPGADRVRRYLDVRACLLTGARGIASAPAAAAWAGMQAASLATRAMVSYQVVAGPATSATAQPYLASLVQRRCRVVVAVDPGPAAAVAADAARFGRVRFVVVAGRIAGPAGVARRAHGPNVVPVSPSPTARIRPAVQAAVTAAVRHS